MGRAPFPSTPPRSSAPKCAQVGNGFPASSSETYYASIVDGIQSKLLQRGIVTEQGIEDLKGEARDKIWWRVHRYYRVPDAEEDKCWVLVDPMRCDR